MSLDPEGEEGWTSGLPEGGEGKRARHPKGGQGKQTVTAARWVAQQHKTRSCVRVSRAAVTLRVHSPCPHTRPARGNATAWRRPSERKTLGWESGCQVGSVRSVPTGRLG